MLPGKCFFEREIYAATAICIMQDNLGLGISVAPNIHLASFISSDYRVSEIMYTSALLDRRIAKSILTYSTAKKQTISRTLS